MGSLWWLLRDTPVSRDERRTEESSHLEDKGLRVYTLLKDKQMGDGFGLLPQVSETAPGAGGVKGCVCDPRKPCVSERSGCRAVVPAEKQHRGSQPRPVVSDCRGSEGETAKTAVRGPWTQGNQTLARGTFLSISSNICKNSSSQ